MIRYEINKGHLKELELNGTTPELVADIAVLYEVVYEKVMEATNDKEYLKTVSEMMRGAMDKAELLASARSTHSVSDEDKELLDFLKGFLDIMKAKAYSEAEGFDDEDE